MNKILILISLILLFASYNFLGRYRGVKDKVILIPAYFYPEGDNLVYWEDIIKYKTNRNKVIVIVNQSNGDFDEVDPNYKEIITKLQKTHIEIQGYVNTLWGQRPPVEVKKNIDAWKNIYNVDSIFLDEASSSKEDYSYYLNLSKYIKGKITYNFGTTPHKVYDKLDGIKILFENSIDNLYLWDKDHPFNKKEAALIVHSVKDEHWKTWFKDNKSSFKYYYFTENTMDNPYDRLTSYLESPPE